MTSTAGSIALHSMKLGTIKGFFCNSRLVEFLQLDDLMLQLTHLWSKTWNFCMLSSSAHHPNNYMLDVASLPAKSEKESCRKSELTSAKHLPGLTWGCICKQKGVCLFSSKPAASKLWLANQLCCGLARVQVEVWGPSQCLRLLF